MSEISETPVEKIVETTEPAEPAPWHSRFPKFVHAIFWTGLFYGLWLLSVKVCMWATGAGG